MAGPVFRDRDGRSFSARRVVAIQHGEVIFNMSASFHAGPDGTTTQPEPMPDVEWPDDPLMHACVLAYLSDTSTRRSTDKAAVCRGRLPGTSQER